MKWIVLVFFTSTTVFAESMDQHRTEIKQIQERTVEGEARIEELKIKKTKSEEGPELEEVLGELADLHKELLILRKRKNLLLEHLAKEHTPTEYMADLGPMKKDSPDSAAKIDVRLDSLLSKIESQYERTIKERKGLFKSKLPVLTSDVTEEDLSGPATPAKKPIKQEDKDRYLKEKAKARIKVTE